MIAQNAPSQESRQGSRRRPNRLEAPPLRPPFTVPLTAAAAHCGRRSLRPGGKQFKFYAIGGLGGQAAQVCRPTKGIG